MQLTPVDLAESKRLGPMAGRCCLITGASGFLGRNLLATLITAGAEVHFTTYSRTAGEIPHGREAHSHPCDLTQLADVKGVFDKVRPEVLFHLAAWRGDEMNDRDVLFGNILGADRLVQASMRWRPQKIIVVSSSLEYGPHSTPLHEGMMLSPHSLFGVTKASSTLLFCHAAMQQQLPITVLRSFSIYGYWEPAKRLIPTAMHAALKQVELPLTATGLHRDFIFVSDLVEALLLAAQTENLDGEIINIGTGTQTSNEEVVARIQAITGLPMRVKADAYPKRATDSSYWCADPSKAYQMLGWKPRHSMDEGLLKTWEWFRDVGHGHLYDDR